MEKIEYEIYKKFRDKDSFYYYVLGRRVYDDWFRKTFYSKKWSYVNSEGDFCVAGAYLSTKREDCETLIKLLCNGWF